MPSFTPEACHIPLLHSAPKRLSFEQSLARGESFPTWRNTMRDKLRELLGETPSPIPLQVQIESRTDGATYQEIRFILRSEANADVPCHLLIPNSATKPVPVVICLQGHSTGMHISLGRTKYPGDDALIRGGDRDFALQVVRQGWAALVIEQRCFGERGDQRPALIHDFRKTCDHAAMTALLLGRTMIGERVWDVSRAIDAVAEFPEINPSRIGCMGNSGGGTIAFYAACLDERIGIVMPSCSLCAFHCSIGDKDHCPDNYIPGILKYFEMGDLTGLIAPRPLIVVAGQDDINFPLDGVKEAYTLAEQIYTATGAPDRCRLIIGTEGHRFYAAQAWPVFRELSDWNT